jgi:hypothetical protein
VRNELDIISEEFTDDLGNLTIRAESGIPSAIIPQAMLMRDTWPPPGMTHSASRLLIPDEECTCAITQCSDLAKTREWLLLPLGNSALANVKALLCVHHASTVLDGGTSTLDWQSRTASSSLPHGHKVKKGAMIMSWMELGPLCEVDQCKTPGSTWTYNMAPRTEEGRYPTIDLCDWHATSLMSGTDIIVRPSLEGLLRKYQQAKTTFAKTPLRYRKIVAEQLERTRSAVESEICSGRNNVNEFHCSRRKLGSETHCPRCTDYYKTKRATLDGSSR